MDKKLFIIGFLIGIIAVFLTLGYYHVSNKNVYTDTTRVRVEVYDTIAYYVPECRDSVVVKYETRVLPVKKDTTAVDGDSTMYASVGSNSVDGDSTMYASVESDSVDVEIPITQKVYESEDYKAYVSGFEPKLDSIFVRSKTITNTISYTKPPDKKFWKDRIGFGITAGVGYGLIHKQADVYIGGGVIIMLR